MTLQEVQKITNDIILRYKKIGKKVFPVTCKIEESSGLNGFSGGECVPMGTSKDCKTLFIDVDAALDLTPQKCYIYIPHELAHCFSNQNHGGYKFEEYLEDYNDSYNPKSPADPEDNYNKQHLPTFAKKDEAYSNIKSNEEWSKLLQTKSWRNKSVVTESYFPY